MTFKNVIILFVLMLVNRQSILLAQSATADIIAMYKKFNSLPQYDLTVDIKVYKDSPKQEVSFSSTGRTAKMNNKFYLNILDHKTIVNNNLMLLIDNKQKYLMYNKITDEQMKVISSPQNLNIDSLVKSQNTQTRYLVNTSEEKKIEMLPPKGGDIKMISMSFNPKTFALKQIIYLYSDETKNLSGNSKVIVTYSNFSSVCKESSLFDQSPFVKIKNDKIEATKEYKHFKIFSPKNFDNKE